MVKNNVRNFSKIHKWIGGQIIKFIGNFNHVVYVKLYIWYLKKLGVDIKGTPIYISPTAYFDGKDYSKIHIGHKTVISSEVLFLTHDYSISRAIEATGKQLKKEVYFLKDIYIGENCFIGARTILLPGCKLGNNVIVGAGSAVRGEILDDSIVTENPAQVMGDTIEGAKKKMAEGNYYENI